VLPIEHHAGEGNDQGEQGDGHTADPTQSLTQFLTEPRRAFGVPILVCSRILKGVITSPDGLPQIHRRDGALNPELRACLRTGWILIAVSGWFGTGRGLRGDGRVEIGQKN
jgi:hypothetical protein